MSRSSFSSAGSIARGRDHRAHYLTSLGIQTNPVEISLKALLEVDVIEIAKLRDLCGKVDLPPSLRPLLWKILLGLFPKYVSAWSFLDKELVEHFQIIKRTNSLLRHQNLDETNRTKEGSLDFTNELPLTCVELLHLRQEMKDLESFLPINTRKALISDAVLVRMATIFARVHSQEHDVFWSLVKFTSSDGFQDAKSELAFALLRSVEAPLSTHLENLIGKSTENLSAFNTLFFTEHFCSMFNAQGIEPIWDKILCSETDFEVLLFVALLKSVKDSLLSLTSIESIVKYLRSANFDLRQAHAIISRALDLKPTLEKLTHSEVGSL